MRWLLRFLLVLQAALSRGDPAAAGVEEFPFEFREGMVWIRVELETSRAPLWFLLDSGAEVSIVDLETSRRLGLALGEQVKVRSVQSTMTGHWLKTLSATAHGIKLPTHFLALDLSKLNGACEQKVAGLIGADFFKNRVVQIDFTAEKIRLLNTSPTSLNRESSPLEIRRGGLCVHAHVNGGKPQRLRLDTGCATGLQWVTDQAQPESCHYKVAVGLAKLHIPQIQTTVSLGGHTFKAVPTGMHRTAIFEGEAGLLGNGILSRFETVTIDSRTRRLSLGRLRESQ